MDSLKKILFERIKTVGYGTMAALKKSEGCTTRSLTRNYKKIAQSYFNDYIEIYFRIWKKYRIKKKTTKCDDCTNKRKGYCSVYKFPLRIIKVDNCKMQETWREYRLESTKRLLKS